MANDWKALATSDLVSARGMLAIAHRHAREHITDEGAVELRDLCEDLIRTIDIYGKKFQEEWQVQDMGAI